MKNQSYTRRTLCRDFSKVINIFRVGNLALFKVTSIHNSRKSNKTETPKKDGTQDGKQQIIECSN